MTKILFICHGNMCWKRKKCCNIKGFRAFKWRYYTITTPIGTSVWQILGKSEAKWRVQGTASDDPLKRRKVPGNHDGYAEGVALPVCEQRAGFSDYGRLPDVPE